MQSSGASLARKIISLIDLTSLNDDDTPDSITRLCEKAKAANVAAVCVYPSFVKQCAMLLTRTKIQIATVANFPSGREDLLMTLSIIDQARADGANEIDVVMPYPLFLAGGRRSVKEFLQQCKQQCANQMVLKVILETGALSQPEHIAKASQLAIEAGADFLKTSTGKVTIGATLPAAEVMLRTIRRTGSLHIGFKAAGGVRTMTQAADYLHLAEKIMGSEWISAKTFRIGASRLVDELISVAEISSSQ